MPVRTKSNRSYVELWTLGHSGSMLLLAVTAFVLRDPRVLGVLGVASLGVLVLLEGGRWTPSGRFGWANAVTLVRAILVAVLSWQEPHPVATLLVIAILALDGLDGFVARRQRTSSSFGALIDMEADALLVLVAGLVLAVRGSLGPWILIPGFLRYLYAVAIRVFPARGEEPRSAFARHAYAVLVAALAVCLWPLEPVARPLALLATLLVLYSFGRSAFWSFLGRPAVEVPE